jgi:NADH-quinone oxidoreductase subunit J
MTPDLILFLVLAALAVATAVAMLASQSAVYSALFLVLNLVTVAVLYLLLNAAFIAMVQVTVYAGAIMVLFLFVIMLLGGQQAGSGPDLPWQRPVSLVLGAALIGLMAYVLLAASRGTLLTAAPLLEGFGSPQSVGRALFTEYLVPFEAVSTLLLAAMVGAIVLTRDERKEGR